MKKLYISVLAFVLGVSTISAQEEICHHHAKGYCSENQQKESPYRKGAVLLFWGWNRALYSKSDIRFKGADYDFTLYNVVAKDRPTELSFNDYLHPGRVTIPQTNARIAYFVKDNVAVVLGLDHMKYVMKQDQKVDFSGNVSDPLYSQMIQNKQVDLSDEKFLTFEHTDGLNYVNIGVEKFNNIYNKKNFDISWSYGAGAGVLYPKSNIKLFGNERSDRFHTAGFGVDARTSINFTFWKHVMVRLEGKYGYINMPDIKTTLNNKPDKAQQDFVFGQLNLGVGYIFQTRKSK